MDLLSIFMPNAGHYQRLCLGGQLFSFLSILADYQLIHVCQLKRYTVPRSFKFYLKNVSVGLWNIFSRKWKPMPNFKICPFPI